MTRSETTGLLGKQGERPVRIPLTGVTVRAETRGPVGRVTVTQEYRNAEDVPVEAVYVFPLPEDSAVTAFVVRLDGKEIQGRVKPKDEAFDEYDDAMAMGHGAFLVDQDRPNIFTASVGNLRPDETISIELSYLTELAAEGDGYRLMIPTTVSPRYVPESSRDFEGMEDGRRVNPPVSVEGVPYRIELTVQADLLSPVRVVESPSHKVRTEVDGNTAIVSLAGDEGALDRDFVLTMVPTEPHRGIALQGREENGDRYALVSFRPDWDVPGERPPVEVVFLVDCSGSMGGPSIGQARSALLLCLQSLSPGDRFNVVRFGTTHESLFRRSKPYDDKTLAKGRRMAKAMIADLGGTEILTPLREVLEAKAVGEMPRRVVLLTDGQVSNEDAVMELAREHRSHASIFAFGIGAGSSEYLVRGLARASRGAAEFVHPGERIEEKVLRHFHRIATAGADFRVTFEGLDVDDVLPREIPALAPGESVTLLARVTAGTEGKAVLSGTVAGEAVRDETPVLEGPRDPGADALVPVLWGRRRIRELEEGEKRGLRRGSQQKRAGDVVDRELVDIGTRFSLMNSAVSFVAVEVRSESERVDERAVLREIPVALTTGWGGIGTLSAPPPPVGGRARSGGGVNACRAMPAQEEAIVHCSLNLDDAVFEEAEVRASRRDPSMLRRLFPRSKDRKVGAASPQRSDPGSSGLPPVLFTQHADGSWDLTAELADACGADLDDLRAAAASLGIQDAERVLATLVATRLVESLPSRVAVTLDPSVHKALLWIRMATHGVTEPAGGWQDWAASLVPHLRKK